MSTPRLALSEVVAAWEAVAGTSSRTAKTAVLAELLRRTADDDLPIAVAFLSGAPRQDRHGIGWATLRDNATAPAAAASLTVAEVDALLQQAEEVAGAGSKARRAAVVADLFGRATADEQAFLTALLHRELRQGAQASALQGAVARATGVPLAAVRRAVMLSDDPGAIAVAARSGGEAALARFRLRVGHPVQPMLAQTAASVTEALASLAGTEGADDDAEPAGAARIEHKLDGMRVQVHVTGDTVRVFTRNLRDATARVPDLVALARSLPVTSVVLDGEAVGFDEGGRALPFQVSMSRFGTQEDADAAAEAVPLSGVFFDVLHLDGDDLLDEPLATRVAALEQVVPERHRPPALVTSDPAAGEAFSAAAVAAGQEGVMVKDLAAPYAAGRRGAAWRKVKPVHTLDLVVLGVERGSGRRSAWLSNLHLGARDDRPDAAAPFVMLGKTFKGLSDDMLRWQTERLGELAEDTDARDPEGRRYVRVRPELVVEIALDGVQASTRYPGGVALRFARVVAHRPDKDPVDADTLSTVRALLPDALR